MTQANPSYRPVPVATPNNLIYLPVKVTAPDRDTLFFGDALASLRAATFELMEARACYEAAIAHGRLDGSAVAAVATARAALSRFSRIINIVLAPEWADAA